MIKILRLSSYNSQNSIHQRKINNVFANNQFIPASCLRKDVFGSQQDHRRSARSDVTRNLPILLQRLRKASLYFVAFFNPLCTQQNGSKEETRKKQGARTTSQGIWHFHLINKFIQKN